MTIKRKIIGALGLIKINIVNWAICNMTPLVHVTGTPDLMVTSRAELRRREMARRQHGVIMRKGKSTMVNRIADWIVAQ